MQTCIAYRSFCNVAGVPPPAAILGFTEMLLRPEPTQVVSLCLVQDADFCHKMMFCGCKHLNQKAALLLSRRW